MKVYNLTDVPTKVLEAQHLVNQHIVVGKELVSPGGSAEVEDTPHQRGSLDHLVAVGALSIDKLPPPYALAKSKPGQTSNVTHPAEVRELVREPEPEPVALPPEPSTGKKKSGK